MVPFSFAGEEWLLVQGRALFWPRENALLVADLHLEKASFFARFGQMLPPYDSRETLERLALALRETGARRVICLGDNFHDGDGPARLEPHAAGMLAALTRVVDWVWIAGNHDGLETAVLPGTTVAELALGGVALRHEARPGAPGLEISGHFHPRLVVKGRGRRVVRPCAVSSGSRLVLPAYGALTGGLDASDPAILGALQPARSIDAMVAAQGRIASFPLWRAVAP